MKIYDKKKIFVNWRSWLFGSWYLVHKGETKSNEGIVINIGTEFEPRLWVKILTKFLEKNEHKRNRF